MREARPSFEDDLSRYSIRPACEDDLPEVLKIEKECYPMPWSEEAFRAELQKPFSSFMVITDDETDTKILAYLVYWLLFDECHVLNVAVGLEWRGLGLAKRLMRHAINVALRREVVSSQKMQRVFLEVRKSNTAAIALYQELGFFIDHVKKEFYEDKEDAYFMVLFLDKPNGF